MSLNKIKIVLVVLEKSTQVISITRKCGPWEAPAESSISDHLELPNMTRCERK